MLVEMNPALGIWPFGSTAQSHKIFALNFCLCDLLIGLFLGPVLRRPYSWKKLGGGNGCRLWSVLEVDMFVSVAILSSRKRTGVFLWELLPRMAAIEGLCIAFSGAGGICGQSGSACKRQ